MHKTWRSLGRRSWREILLDALTIWNRHQVGRVVAAILLAWVLGAVALYFAERRVNPKISSWADALWAVWVLLFSGLEDAPESAAGRLVAMVILVIGVGSAGVFTASVASLLVARFLRRRKVSEFETEDHLVLCNWSARGIDWIREVHAKIIVDKRPIVIIHDDPDAIELPDIADDPAFNDVFIVKGDPTSELSLRRARIANAHSVVILTDDREGRHADGKSILICIAIRSICRGENRPNISAECLMASNRHHLRKAGADEIISSEELGLRLLARSALYHGMTHVYQELLTVGRNANEMYLLPAPAELLGKDFAELSAMFVKHREDKKACLLVGIQRGDDMHLNPIGGEAGPLKSGDQLILLSRVFIKPHEILPTVPPVDPNKQEKEDE